MIVTWEKCHSTVEIHKYLIPVFLKDIIFQLNVLFPDFQNSDIFLEFTL